ncbi:histone deacetylase, partial [archaeon]
MHAPRAFAPPQLPTATQVPLYYRPEYNIRLWGLERLHPFDSCKYEAVFCALRDASLVTADNTVQPALLSEEELQAAHSDAYLRSLESSISIARVAEVPPAACVPSCLLKRNVLQPFRYAARGSIDAAHAALSRGVGINLGGGFHHASREFGHGFCVYNDISMAIWAVRETAPEHEPPLRVMIVDLDAHQGDGHERDFMGDHATHILDCYRPGIFPDARDAMRAIHTSMHFRVGDDGHTFLAELRTKLPAALATFRPHLVVYNAGTDILIGDPLSGLTITAENVVARDELVFECCGYPRVQSVQPTTASGVC